MPRTTPRERSASPLAAARISAGLTQAQLADIVGCYVSDISRYEVGKVTPRIDTAFKIAKALDVPIESIFAKHGI